MKNMSMVPIALNVIDGSVAETFDITFNGVSSFNYDLMLYDAYTGMSTNLYDGITVTLTDRGSNVICYFIIPSEKTATSLDDADATDNMLRLWSEDNGTVVVSSNNTDIQTITVYNAIGQKIQHNNVWARTTTLHLLQGVYMLKVRTEEGENILRTIVR